jgi:type I restriction enzyme M protein
VKDATILEQYDLGHIWRKNKKGQIYRTDDLVTSRAPEVLFIERCWQFLRPGGRMAIVLPDAILGAPGVEYASIREWIFQHCRIIASIDLHADTFQPKNGTQTSVLFLQKKTPEEMEKENRTRQMDNYNIFFAMVDRIGHDKRGNTIFKRDREGNEILVPETNDLHIDHISDGTLTIQNAPKKKLVDDQTDVVADTFLKWKRQEGIEW